ncbi:MAG: TPR domain protein in aerotolerance operon [Candidatus Ozemobacter sibiricus]|uniref:TPR domain protein in aerotolerance operon n=1 Tax=Candidatus Ozemobacter sibiricus TaxID=2268124 RepID=A0A367ZSV2_9BACT|nr:MAG: TPR domain protein in aerotolerance operon [Candidatus Ozemobacter sibiricus]
MLGGLLWCAGGPAAGAHPADDVAWAQAALAKGDLEAAEAALHRARFADPDDPRLLYNLGVVQYRKRNYLDAARSFAEAARAAPDPAARADALHNLGNAAYRAARFQEAIGAYQASLDLREDAMTRYNLEQARKRLQEEMERRAQTQPDQPSPTGGQPGQDQPQGGQANSSPGGEGSSQGGQDRQPSGQGESKQDGQSAEQRADQSGQQGPDGQAGQPQTGPSGQDQASRPDGASPKPGDQARTPDSRVGTDTPEMGLGSDTAEVGPEGEKERQDLAMAQPDREKPPPADISQRARAMKNIKLNAYAVEKLLRDLEEREKEVQRRYRRDPQRDDSLDEEFDPFFMTPDQLRDFIDRRSGRRAQPKSDSPDW